MKTGNPIMDAVSQFDCAAYQVPASWYHTIVKESGKPHYNAIAVLAEILEWYRPQPVYNSNGYLTGYQAHFDGDYLPRSYEEFGESLNISKQQAYRAIHYLESIGLVKRHYYDKIIDPYNIIMNNNLMVELIPERLYEVTFRGEKDQVLET